VAFVLVAVAVAGINLVAIAVGYYIGLGHINRMLDIDEGTEERAFPPGFEARESERIGPLSPDEIDDIDEWDRRE